MNELLKLVLEHLFGKILIEFGEWFFIKELPSDAYIRVLQRLHQVRWEDIQVAVWAYKIGMNDEGKIYHIMTSDQEWRLFSGLDFTIPSFINFIKDNMTIEDFLRLDTQFSFASMQADKAKNRTIRWIN